MKRIKLNYLSLIIMASCAMSANAYDFEVGGIYYNINGNEATVTSADDDYNTTDYSGEIVIPTTVSYEGVTYIVNEIGDNAFFGCNTIISIQIPNSVNYIGEFAFMGCSGIKSISIPNSIITIGALAFDSCI